MCPATVCRNIKLAFFNEHCTHVEHFCETVLSTTSWLVIAFRGLHLQNIRDLFAEDSGTRLSQHSTSSRHPFRVCTSLQGISAVSYEAYPRDLAVLVEVCTQLEQYKLF